ncbi:hypothetical protein [Rhodococcus ruber]|uniref:hypothetical protein n=1 Tax=Rhodococcus ruber TaxID=1830 RepID=UPI001F16B736|nr:hypothetical protein [Rhodococcus ruber]MCF8784146.1 hypothetical protein [Rhodococcus ruber]
MSQPTALNARSVLAMLDKHYNAPNRPKSWLFAPEIQAPHSDRRADLIVAPLSSTAGEKIIGHEIKVSRADVLSELATPIKHDDWAKYCTHWWLVIADLALIDGLDIPAHWGVMAPPSGRRTRSMTILKPAPELNPHSTEAAWAKLARWTAFRAEERVTKLQYEAQYDQRRIESLKQNVRELQASGAGGLSPALRRAQEIVDEVTQRCNDEGIWFRHEPGLVADAVVDVLATREAAQTQRREIENIEHALRPKFNGLADDIARAKRLAAAVNPPLVNQGGHHG